MKTSFTFQQEQFNRLFPFYILINHDLRVESNGRTLEKIFPGSSGNYFGDFFLIKRPEINNLSAEAIRSLENQLSVIECKNNQKTALRGQFEYLPETNQLLFIGSPWFGSIEQVIENSLTLHDFAYHDPMIDLLHVLKTQEITTEDLKQLLQTINKQKKDLKAANEEIKNIALFPTQNPDPLIRINLVGDILRMNPAAEKLLVFEFENNTYSNKELFKQIAPHIDRTSERWVFETRANGKDYSFVCITMEGLGYVNIYGRDITQAKKDQQQLEQLSLIIEETQNSVIVTDSNGKVEWVNKAFEKVTGYTIEEVKGKTPGSILQGIDTDPATMQYMSEQIRNSKPFTCEVYNYKKSGEGYWLRINAQPIFDTVGKVKKYFAIEEDITKEREAEEKLKEFDRQIYLAMQKIGDNVWEHDFTTEHTSFSQQEFQLLGYSAEEFSNNVELWYNRIHEEDKKIVQENDIKYRKGQIDHHSLEYRMIHKDGTVKWVLDRGVVIEWSEEDKPLKIIGTHTDITNQKITEQELILAKNAAESSTRAKELFLANMSHEIRTPMNAIMGMANQLAKTNLNPDQQLFLNTIQSASDNLLIIINDILDLTKIEAGKLTLEHIGFAPKQVIDRAIQVMMHKAEEKGLSLTISYYDEKIFPVYKGDPYRLNQILLNLISNSIKFTEKGAVDISCKVISQTESLQKIRIRIKDTGIGMDESFVNNIFKKFTQEDDSVSRKFGGTGLGMSICKELVELMGGKIFVGSKKREGTTVSFEIEFEKGKAEDLPTKESSTVNSNILAGKKLLVVDDNEMNRLVASTILKGYGADTTEVANGLEAVHAIKDHPFDLVLMDMQMPVMNGLEATVEIRNTLQSNIPIIAVTANAIKGENEKCFAVGMNDYLAKPFEENQLLQVVSRWLGKIQQNKPNDKINIEAQEKENGLYDLSKLEDIAKGNQSFIDKMIRLFKEQAPMSVHEIKTAYEAKNFEMVKKIAHRMKPSIDNMGIRSLTNEIREIEKSADVYQTSERLEELIRKLDTTIHEVVAELN